jgi:hypothetical protein
MATLGGWPDGFTCAKRPHQLVAGKIRRRVALQLTEHCGLEQGCSVPTPTNAQYIQPGSAASI